MTTKILALTDALGNLLCFVLLPGQRFDTVGIPPLLDGVAFKALVADKAFDSNAIIADLNARGSKVVISQHSLHVTLNGRRILSVPVPTHLFRSFTEGVYYGLMDKPGFSAAFGAAFQKYVGDAAQAANVTGRYRPTMNAESHWRIVRANGL